MADGSDDVLQVQVRRNVKVLMAMNGIDHVRDLARRIERNENWLSRKVAGQRDFQLSDLTVLAAAFGLQPADLLRPVHEVVGAVAATGTGIMEGIKHPYSPAYSPAPPLTSNDAGRRKGHLTLLPPTSEADTNDDNEADREQRSARGQLTASPDWSASARVMVAV